MKSLIKPLIVASFILMLTGLVPGVNIGMAVLGFVTLLTSIGVGAVLLEQQDREFDSRLALLKLELESAHNMNTAMASKYDQLLTSVSRGLSDVRKESSGLR